MNPVGASALWGTVAVGVEVDPFGPPAGSRVRLRLSTGETLDPVSESDPALGPVRHLVFRLDTGAIPAGPLDLIPLAIAPDGAVTAGLPVHVRVVHPAAADVLSIEAEEATPRDWPALLGATEPGLEEAYGSPSIGVDPAASGGEYVLQQGVYPPVVMPVRVARTRRYQVAIVARGQAAGGAWPNVGVLVAGEDEARTSAPVVSGEWHRIAIGHPVQLEAGDRLLVPLFLDDFYAGAHADRNLDLDRVELLALEGAIPRRVSVAFERPLEGWLVAGWLEFGASCRWDGEGDPSIPPPVVEVVVDGEVVSRQVAGAPRFRIAAGRLAEGSHEIQLVARLDSGEEARSPVQRVDGRLLRREDGAVADQRYTAWDAGWDRATRKGASEGALHVGRRAVLELADDLAGDYAVLLEGAAEDAGATFSVSLQAREGSRPVGRLELAEGPGPHTIGSVRLVRGPKRLVLAGRVRLEALLLQAARNDSGPPVVRFLYPPEEHEVTGGIDAVVAEVADDGAVLAVQLLLDAAQEGPTFERWGADGRLVVPLLAGALTPGAHSFRLRVRDQAGRFTDSEARTIRIPEVAPEAPGPYERAVRLLDRLAYGPEPYELADVLVLGEEAWLADRLGRPFDERGDIAALRTAVGLFGDEVGEYGVAGRAVHHALLTPDPARLRFVEWADDHVSTWMGKTGARHEWDERLRFLRLGVAPFPDLLAASATSPAMLRYLDQEASFAGSLNENYARELMELHTLGVDGGYSQEDVTSLAKLLTGWRMVELGDGRGGSPQRGLFRFDPALAERGALRWLGVAFPAAAPADRFDRVRFALEVLAAHPNTARSVAEDLAERYLGAPAPEAAVGELARIYLETHGDLGRLLAWIAHDPAGGRVRIASAFDFAVRAGRANRALDPWSVLDFLDRCGRGPFGCPTPDGWPEEDAAAADSQSLLRRWHLAKALEPWVATAVPWSMRGGEPPDDAWRAEVLDRIAVAVTGRALGESSRAAGLALLQAESTRDELVLAAATYVLLTPEAQLR